MKNTQNPTEELTPEQVQERQLKRLKLICKDIESIKKNVQFFFWLTIVAIVIGFIIIKSH